MAKMVWTGKNDVLAGYPAIRLSRRSINDDLELCLSGSDGEVWHKGGDFYKAFTKSYIAAKEHGYKGDFIQTGDEYLVTVHISSLPSLLKSIGYSASRTAQAAWANRR